MAKKKSSNSTQKDSKDWKTEDEPATEVQEFYIEKMAIEVDEEPAENLTKDEASKIIKKLQEETGRSTAE